MVPRKPCWNCKGAGWFWTKPASSWPQGEEEPKINPTPLCCPECKGTGEARREFHARI
jgi:hypothetical protein